MEKVKAGDKVEIKAETWNAFIDAANFARSMKDSQGGKGIKAGMNEGIVLIKNDEEDDFPRFAALVLSDILISPETNEDEFVSRPPVFVGKRMVEKYAGKPYGILMEPIAAGMIGRAMILGVTPAQVYVNEEAHEYVSPIVDSEDGSLESSESGTARILWKAGVKGTYWSLLQIGGAGGGGAAKAEETVFMCRVQTGNAQNGYTVSVYNKDRDGSLGSGVLYVPDIALNSELPQDTWIIGHKCALRTTGGNDR